MKKITICIIALLAVCAASVKAQQNNIVSEHALVWRITGNGLKQPSYIMGTMHTQHPKILDHIAGFQEAWNSTEQLAVEVKFDSIHYNMGQKEIINLYRLSKFLKKKDFNMYKERAYLPDSISYDSLIDKERITYLREYCKDNPENLRLRPNVLRNEIELQRRIMTMESCMFNVKNNISLKDYESLFDWAICHKAVNEGRNIIGLDRLEDFQSEEKAPSSNTSDAYTALRRDAYELVDVLAVLPSDSVLTKALDSYYYEHTPELMLNAVKQYCNAFYNVLEEAKALPYETEKENRHYIDSIFMKKYSIFNTKERNEYWMTQIPTLMQQKPTLIAVGVAHLIQDFDDRGLIARLREMGYTLTPIVYKGEDEPLQDN